MKTGSEYLEHYYKKYNIPFRVQHWTKTPQPWTNYGTQQYKEYIQKHETINHREILPDEVVIDVDIDGDAPITIKQHKTQTVGKILYERIIKEIPQCSIWKSGGDGCHIHMFFPELMKYNSTHRGLLKKLIKKHFGKGYLRVPEGDAHVCQGNPILIQLEEARHRKGGIKTPLFVFTSALDRLNQIPSAVMESFSKNKTNYENKRVFNLNPGTPKAIQFLENEDFSGAHDGRSRALFILACYYANFMQETELFKKLDKWNRYQLRGYLRTHHIRATVRGVVTKRKKLKDLPLFPYNYLRDLMEELGFECDYSDIKFTTRKEQRNI